MLLSGDLRRRFVLRKARSKAVEVLMKDGFKVVGGSPKARTYEDAWKLIDHVDDQSILANIPKNGELWDNIVQKIQDLVQWIKDHQEEILRIVSIILSLALLFLDEHESEV
jgi:hypothetical protein